MTDRAVGPPPSPMPPISRLPLTHAAYEMGRVVVGNVLGWWRRPRRYQPYATPWVTFTDPEAGRVGLTEAQAADLARSVSVRWNLTVVTPRRNVAVPSNRHSARWTAHAYWPPQGANGAAIHDRLASAA